jgi:hypothetical protein
MRKKTDIDKVRVECNLVNCSDFCTSSECRCQCHTFLRMWRALDHLANCDLNDSNCASLEVATRRIRNLARIALGR